MVKGNYNSLMGALMKVNSNSIKYEAKEFISGRMGRSIQDFEWIIKCMGRGY